MDDKTLVERLRMTGKRISVPCPDGIDGCLVHHFRIETDPLCEEAATRIEALEAALRDAAKAERDRLRELAKEKGFLSVEDIEQALESKP